ncbi:MAG: DUF4215 domain-containing protein [Myxococcales bacterium]|nr:DUF4215 domain-containing protein [Myxococcales bacterium]MCB9714202.1 DUF4215 domain-containing protein [Myxococcales bacterium]
MQTRTWLNPLTACTLLALTACPSDDVPTVPDTDTEGTTGGDTTTGTPMTTSLDDTAGSESGDTGSDAVCGDGMLGGSETCDDGNTDADDGCSATCTVEDGYACDDAEPSVCGPVCGDGLIVDTEECDDANTDADDGCSDTCMVEDGFTCDDLQPSTCEPVCGDGIVAGMEECDDANTDVDDGCSDTCTVEPGWACAEEPSVCMTGCGDGIVAGMEECDDGGGDSGDGCSARCTVETGWVCMGEPSMCAEDCGDGLIVGMEECDDGDTDPGDGCSDLCGVELGWYCTGEPSDCDTECGDGLLAGTEVCDDGNLSQGDGCNPLCEVDFPYSCDMASPSSCTVTETLAAVTLGGASGCILTGAGEAACFGSNAQGQTGNLTTGQVTMLPVPVLDTVESLTAGDEHNCAVRTGGEVWCWGDNANSQMGPLSAPPNDELSPIQVTGLPVIVAVEAGVDHNCAIDVAGTVWCWGDNDNRQLGRGGTTTTDDANPGAVALPQPAIDLGLGENHSCAVVSNNNVWCWGDDDSGQLGDGVILPDSGDPLMVVGLPPAVEVEAGRDATCALDTMGGVWCWGNNNDGEVGDGTVNDTAVPQAVALPQPADDISLGINFSCALLTTDAVYCWGEGSDYQLGYGDIIDQLTPVEVQGLPAGDIVDLEVGARGACVMTAANERHCWGFSETGYLGLAPRNQLDLDAPLAFSGPVAEVRLSVPEYRGVLCGVLTDGTVECAGDGTLVTLSTVNGADGLFGSTIDSHLADLTPIPGLTGVLDMSFGNSFACARTSTQVLCWGDNSNLQLGQGDGSTVDIIDPTPVVTLGTVDEIDVGHQFACARTAGNIVCWGDNDGYQTGIDGVTTDQTSPVTVPTFGDAVDVECGENHACALRSSGVVSCWGDDGASQLGDNDGNINDSGIPVDVTGLPGPADQLVVGQDHGCALVGTEVYCWGDATYGQLGQGNTTDSDTALLVPGLGNIVQIATGNNYTCARDDMDTLTCWGYGDDGHLGNGGVELSGINDALSPVPFTMATGVLDMELGNSSTCVLTAAGWQCLGFRGPGQLGNGTSLTPSFPTPTYFGL